ncbi:hypothetical protein CRUP_008022 [Coryphaenoides rupestris]|nr:hypothetical protein CRUP_008022 [Coryphaenoides rupestris]
MRIWMPSWNLPNVLSGLCVHVVFLLGSVRVACSDRTPEQLAAIMNCSKHERHTRNYDYMEGGDVRIRQLFSRTQTVSEGGVLAIKGVKSQYYISMNRTGQLQGKRNYNDNCNFKEVFLENYFNAYSSARWIRNGREMFIALSQKGRPLRGRKTRREHVASHFIPMKCREEERRVD